MFFFFQRLNRKNVYPLVTTIFSCKAFVFYILHIVSFLLAMHRCLHFLSKRASYRAYICFGLICHIGLSRDDNDFLPEIE